jgi:hypothetical protein
MILICETTPVFAETPRCPTLRGTTLRIAGIGDDETYDATGHAGDEYAEAHNRGTIEYPVLSLDERRRRMLRDTELFLSNPRSKPWALRIAATAGMA